MTDILQKIPGADISDIVAGIQQAIDVIEQLLRDFLTQQYLLANFQE